jgi:hypothetical protein
MGEAKRRRQLDPNYGKSNVLENACEHINELLSQQVQIDEDTAVFSLFTNHDRGCSEKEIQLLQTQIPLLYQQQNFTLWVLPNQYASKPVEQALDYFVPIEVKQ